MDIFESVTDDVRNKVFEMFDRTQKSANKDVLIVKDWLKTQPHLPEIMIERKIVNFLSMNKFSIEKTKKKIDMYYSIRSVIPEFFEGFIPNSEKQKNALENMYCCLHPKAKDQLYRVFFMKNCKKNEFDVQQLVLQSMNIAEVRLFEDVMVGEIIILDMDLITVYDSRKFTPTMVARIFAAYEKVYSLRLRGIYLINSPSYTKVLITILKQVLKPKIFDRVHVDCGIDSLREIFSQNDLPKDYGGDGPSLQELQEITIKKLNEYQGFFKTVEKLKIKEELRPQKLNNDEILGYHGTFKTLDLD